MAWSYRKDRGDEIYCDVGGAAVVDGQRQPDSPGSPYPPVGGGAGTGDFHGPANSAVGEMVLFGDTSGKLGQRSTALGTGIAKLTAGIPSVATPGTDYADLAFRTIAVSGQSSVVADTGADTLTFVGSGVVITTNAATDTITFTATTGAGTITGDGALVTGNVIVGGSSTTSIADSTIALSSLATVASVPNDLSDLTISDFSIPRKKLDYSTQTDIATVAGVLVPGQIYYGTLSANTTLTFSPAMTANSPPILLAIQLTHPAADWTLTYPAAIRNSDTGSSTSLTVSLAQYCVIQFWKTGAGNIRMKDDIGAVAGSGTVTTTGSPATGALALFSGSTSITSGNLAGAVTTAGNLTTVMANNAVVTSKIADANVTYAKIQNISANSVVLGSSATGAGAPPSELTFGTGFSTTGSVINYAGTLISGTPTADQNTVWINATTVKGVNTIKGGSAAQVLTKNSGSDYDYVWATPAAGGAALTEDILAYGALGSTMYGHTLTVGIPQVTVATAMTSGTFVVVPVWLATTNALTGAKWWQAAAGAYTPNNNNRIGLFTYSAGTLTLVAATKSTANGDNGLMWQQTQNTAGSKPFDVGGVSTTYTPPAVGLYYVGFLWSNSAQTTVPTIGYAASALSASLVSFDFTNSGTLFATKGSQTDLPTSMAMSTMTVSTARPFMALY